MFENEISLTYDSLTYDSLTYESLPYEITYSFKMVLGEFASFAIETSLPAIGGVEKIIADVAGDMVGDLAEDYLSPKP